MIFKPELIEKIVTRDKTQTRRPVKADEVLRQIESPHGGYKPIGVYQHNRAKMLIGKDYAVVPGRGKRTVLWIPNSGRWCTPDDEIYAEMYDARTTVTLDTVFAPPGEGFEFLRIRICDIRREDVRKISLDDAIDEGFNTRNEFWEVWCGFYDKPALEIIAAHKPHNVIVQAGLLQERPDELYQAWAYTFEILR